jgi:DNA primase
MLFAKDFPDQLRSQISTSSVVGKRVALKKKGKEFSGLCPFHNEKTPSFTVNDQKGFYHCFGCTQHGDIITFVMKTQRLEFKDAILKLADDFGIKVPVIENSAKEKEKQSKIEVSYNLLESACNFFENNLHYGASNQALNYLQKRGLSIENIKKFRLGFAPGGYENLINHLKSLNFSDAELLESGVISKNDKGKLYDKFRSRIIFPITNSKGKVIAFGGRIIGDGQPKYLNSSETELFKKGHNLYNLSLAKKTIFDQKFVVLVEGYMDAISLSVNGIENVVAPLGTALTQDQLKMLFNIIQDVVICLDGDQAGIKAMRRSIDIALPIIDSKNLVRFAILPNNCDPDDFVKTNGKTAMQNLLKNSANLSQVLFDFEAQDCNLDLANLQNVAPEIKANLEAKLMQKVSLISDANTRKYFLQYYKNYLFELGRNKKFIRKNIATKSKFHIAHNLDKQSNYAISIISILVAHKELINYQDEFCQVRNLEFAGEELCKIKELLIDFVDHNSSAGFEDIKACLNENISDKKLLNKIINQKFSDTNLESAKQKLKILLLKNLHEEVSQQYAQILSRIDDIDTDEIKIKTGKQKELFDYKTFLEKKILQYISDLM